MNNRLFVPDEVKQHLRGDVFEALMQMTGKAYRDVPGRKTIQMTLGDKSYFIKQHFGVGWAEIFKNLMVFKKPILGAMTEVNAIQKLEQIDILTTPLVAYGQQGCNPATMRSFVMTEDLGEIITIEDLYVDWKMHPPAQDVKQKLIQAIAQLAAKLHGAGLCHRDFYLCHFVLKKQDLQNADLNLYLIDLHRMLQGQAINGSAVMKDVAGLFFSAMQCGFQVEDFTLFKQHYLAQSPVFWARAEKRAQKLYAKFNSEKFQKRLADEKSSLN